MSDIILAPGHRPLGKSGLSVSPIAWGMWRFGHQGAHNAQALVEAVLAAGVTLFDTADIYGLGTPAGFGGAEALLGRVLAQAPLLRAQMILATKGGIAPPVPYDSGRNHLMAALEASLRRLGVERIDLYQIHRPDVLTHPQELARTLEDMVGSGKVRAIGVSNYMVAQIQALSGLLAVPLASFQPEFSPLTIDPLEDGLLDVAMERGAAVLAWSPLGGGRLAAPADARTRAVAAALDVVANEAGISRAAAAYGWIMAHPARAIPIAGTQNAGRIGEIPSVFKARWTRARWYDVLAAARGAPLP
ncbi:MAG: aldo/keto reductase [Sphingomonas sp.]|jgi:aryl-alcohol dehydrogenase-like predicted oxidoreductase